MFAALSSIFLLLLFCPVPAFQKNRFVYNNFDNLENIKFCKSHDILQPIVYCRKIFSLKKFSTVYKLGLEGKLQTQLITALNIFNFHNRRKYFFYNDDLCFQFSSTC
jgi:hypothetical protein